MTTSVSYLSNIQQILTQYGMTTYVAFGNLGNLLTIIIFCRSEHRKNSCSLYLLSMTICNLICLNVGIVPIIVSLYSIDISTQYLISCQLQFYIRHAFFQMMRTYKILICIDRYAICSSNIKLRAFNNHKLAIRLIIITGLFWLLIAIFFSVTRSIQNGSCNIFNTTYSMIYTIYYMITAGILPPVFIIFFNFLLIQNLKYIRTRVQPTANGQHNKQSNTILRKHDRDLIKMTAVELMVYVVNTIPFSIYLVYKMITDSVIKSQERKQIESFINYILQSFIMYLNTALPFYIYMLASSSFRQELRRILFNLHAFITGKRIVNSRDITMTN